MEVCKSQKFLPGVSYKSPFSPFDTSGRTSRTVCSLLFSVRGEVWTHKSFKTFINVDANINISLRIGFVVSPKDLPFIVFSCLLILVLFLFIPLDHRCR